MPPTLKFRPAASERSKRARSKSDDDHEMSRSKRARLARDTQSVKEGKNGAASAHSSSSKRRTLTLDSRRTIEANRKRKTTILQHRKERKRLEKLGKNNGKKETKEGTIVLETDEKEESFWEMEKVLGRRVRKGKVEYLIRWKGCPESENTWEPSANLCDSAMADAIRFTKRQKMLEQKREEDERRLGLGLPSTGDDEASADESSVDAEEELPAELPTEEDESWKWNDEEQVNFREVERINVHDADARERVTELRMNGVPVVLVGHVGWANFAKRWLKARKPASSTLCALSTSDDAEKKVDSWLDLSLEHELDIPFMIEDIGSEDVPVVRRNYNEENPIHGVIPASKFLSTCWPNKKASKSNGTTLNTAPRLYLHQWQFPLSETAAWKLCHQNNPLPNDILGEDLLKYWLDLPQCILDSPLQYIFMGREETLSKLHRDSGGLDISIAPILGEKECVLVHRSDGATCLYHLTAQLDAIDLQAFPLMSQARVWKTIVRPGEILFMPQGTYHQCRNVTPCLSYSRFHLDKLNLLPFLQSMIDGDAPEIEHGDIIWNCTTELIRKVDAYVDEVQAQVKTSSRLVATVDAQMLKMVETLRTLRHICREIARRTAVRNAVKGKSDGFAKRCALPSSEAMTVHSGRPIGKMKYRANAMTNVARAPATTNTKRTENSDDHDWDIIVDDIDVCLHEFRHRQMAKIPSFRPRQCKEVDKAVYLRKATGESSGVKSGEKKVATPATDSQKDATPVVAYSTELERAFVALPNVPTASLATPLSKRIILSVEDNVLVHMHGKAMEGTILAVEADMGAAYLSYEDYPSLYDEFQPYERLRVPIGGESSAEVRPEDIKPGLMVLNRWGHLGEEYRAVVTMTVCEPFFKVRLDLGRCHMDRWLTRNSIMEKRQSRREKAMVDEISPLPSLNVSPPIIDLTFLD